MRLLPLWISLGSLSPPTSPGLTCALPDSPAPSWTLLRLQHSPADAVSSLCPPGLYCALTDSPVPSQTLLCPPGLSCWCWSIPPDCISCVLCFTCLPISLLHGLHCSYTLMRFHSICIFVVFLYCLSVNFFSPYSHCLISDRFLLLLSLLFLLPLLSSWPYSLVLFN